MATKSRSWSRRTVCDIFRTGSSDGLRCINIGETPPYGARFDPRCLYLSLGYSVKLTRKFSAGFPRASPQQFDQIINICNTNSCAIFFLPILDF